MVWPAGQGQQQWRPFSPVGPSALKSALGLNLNWFGAGYEGPGPLAGMINGAMAIAAGLCRHVLVFRTITEASARLHNKQAGALSNKTQGRDSSYAWQWFTPFNVLSGINLMALYAQRHFHEYGTRPEQLAQIALTCRQNAMRNPKAIYRTPMSLDDYMQSRMISTPLRMFDCDALRCLHCDRPVSPRCRTRWPPCTDTHRVDWRRAEPALVLGSDLLTEMAAFDVGRMMWQRTDYTPDDVDSAQLYDGFSILTMIWLEALGLCPVGESGAFVEGGQRIALDGSLPINTNGGQLSGGRTHGLGYVHEACLQLWGRAEGRQTTENRVSVVAAGGGPLGGSLLLVRE